MDIRSVIGYTLLIIVIMVIIFSDNGKGGCKI